ncbi:MAG: DUF732 domain-containing protein [Mycobacterium sp.]|uniref:DUF732 domain-containing protein n=1 Tax=Mycobacterium sp. TaxID=1785 RepID=UPI003F94C4D1
MSAAEVIRPLAAGLAAIAAVGLFGVWWDQGHSQWELVPWSPQAHYLDELHQAGMPDSRDRQALNAGYQVCDAVKVNRANGIQTTVGLFDRLDTNSPLGH